MADDQFTDIVQKFGGVVGVEKATGIVTDALAEAGVDDDLRSADDVVQICRVIEDEESGVIANVAHEIRVRAEMERQFERLFSVLPDPAIIVTLEYGSLHVLNANDEAHAKLDLGEDGGDVPSLDPVTAAADVDDFEGYVESQIVDGGHSRRQLTLHQTDGPAHYIVHVSSVGTELFARDGPDVSETTISHRGIVLFTDITEQKRRQRRLEHFQQVTDVLNRVLRHNLRNDMNVVLGRVDHLEDAVDGDRAASESIQAITAAGERLLEISDNARTIQEAVGDLTREEVEVVELLTDHLRAVEDEHGAVEVRTDVPDEVYAVGDPFLDAVFENVLENAVKHNDKARPLVAVRVSRDRENGSVIVEVADDGPGVPDRELDVLDRGFETRLKHGTGLGIWLVSWIVDQYGGDVSFEDREPEGTRVVIELEEARATDV